MTAPAQQVHYNERIDALERELVALRSSMPRSAPPARRKARRNRVLTTIATAIVLIALPAIAVASDTFADVPNSNIFHNQINAIKDAGITAGCGGPNYCPNQAVTRGQMAGFMHRGYGRVAWDGGFGSVPTELVGTYDVANVSVMAGDVIGGQGYILVQGAASLTAPTTTPCPCTIQVRPVVDGAESSTDAWEVIEDVGGPYGGSTWRFGSASTSDVFLVDTGTSHSVVLRVTVTRTASAAVGIESSLSAVFIPFNGAGEVGAAGAVAAPEPVDANNPVK